jgi:hypothetical protein
MRQEIRNKHLHVIFDSLGDFIDSQTSVPDERGVENTRHGGLDREFNGVSSMDEAIGLARKGAVREGIEGLDYAHDKIEEMDRDLISQGFQWRFSEDTGSEIDVARYLSGDSDYLVEYYLNDVSLSTPVVTLVIGSAVSCAISTNAIMEHGKRLVALVDAIESTGKVVELWIDYLHSNSYNAKDNATTARQSILLKAPGQFLDAGQMFHALTHASMFRALGFNAVGAYPDQWYRELNASFSYGYCVMKAELHESKDYPEGTTYMKPLERDSEANWSVENQLKDLGLWRDGNTEHHAGCNCIKCGGDLA